MSVNHPFLRQLKAQVNELCNSGEAQIQDSNPVVETLCKNIESILCNGLRCKRYDQQSERYFRWFAALLETYPVAKLTSPVQFCVDYARSSKKVMTDVGRGRLVIRCCLNSRSLSKCVRLLRESRNFLLMYYDDISIIGDEILSEIFLSLLLPLECNLKFELNLRASSFLDDTWQLPCLRQYEFVPCARIGINISSVDSRIIVQEVESGSVADEDLKIEPGDIVDDLFGRPLRNISVPKAMQLLRDFKGAPIYISIIKCLNPDGHFYAPALQYLEAAGLDKQITLDWREKRLKELRDVSAGEDDGERKGENNIVDAESVGHLEDEEVMVTEDGRFPCKVLGFVNVGPLGTVKQIETGVPTVVKQGTPGKKREILLKLSDTGVIAYCAKNKDEILWQHSFPEIASCGRRIDYPLNFSYIVGHKLSLYTFFSETSCNLARVFHCYVFEARNAEQSKEVLQSIADGFERTHWAV